MRKSTAGVTASMTMLCLCGSAHAVIIDGEVTSVSASSASFIELSLPFEAPSGDENTVGNNTFQTPNLYGFNEDQNILLEGSLSVDLLADTGSAGSLAPGTTVASHYVFFDPDNSTTQTGYVDFDSDILALITSTSLLSGSDFLINNNVDYLNPGLRGLESVDSATIDATNANRVNVDWRASTPGDYIRVLTARSEGGEDPCATNPPGVGGCPPDDSTKVPEPGGLALLAFGLLGAGTLRRLRSVRG